MGRRTFLGLSLLASSWSVTNAQKGAFYPEGHFDTVTKFTDLDGFQSHMEESIPTGKTTFAPSWNDVTRLFQGNEDVAFGDVLLKEAPGFRGEPHNPGQGGWPTIRYFNQKTGSDGGSYVKLTDQAMCAELGDRMKMIDYVESYGSTILCGLDGANCNKQELDYLQKYKGKSMIDIGDQMDRLETMLAKPMKDELRLWGYRRMRILNRLLESAFPQESESESESESDEL